MPRFRSAGDSALTVYFPAEDGERSSRRVRQALRLLDARCPPGVLDAIPARASLLLVYDPLVTSREALESWLSETSQEEEPQPAPALKRVPVLYGGDAGQDLPEVASRAGLTESDAVELHCSVEYTVYCLGFMPGFPYLGPLPEQLRLPRLETPRTHVPAGSVAVAEDQTGIYPVASPGGWRLIGRTPLQLFDPAADPPAALQPGDLVRFVPIDEAAYSRMHFQVLAGQSPELEGL